MCPRPGSPAQPGEARPECGSGVRRAVHLLALLALAAPAMAARAQDPPQRLAALLEGAEQANARGDFEDAREACRLVLDLVDGLEPDQLGLPVSNLCWDLGFAAQEAGDPQSTRRAWRWATRIRERLLPADHPALQEARVNLGNQLMYLGELDEAEELMSAVLAVREKILEVDDPGLLRVRSNLATIRFKKGDVAGARACFEAVLSALLETREDDDPDVLRARSNLAAAMSTQGDFAGAICLGEQVVAAREKTLASDHPDLLRSRLNLANSMRMMGDHRGARVLLEDVLAQLERRLSADHPMLLGTRATLADLLLVMGSAEEAGELLEKALEDVERALPETHQNVQLARRVLATVYVKLGREEEGLALYGRQIELQRSVGSPDPLILAIHSADMTSLMLDAGRFEAARELLESVGGVYRERLPADHPKRLDRCSFLIWAEVGLGEPAEATAHLRELMAGLRSRTAGALGLSPREQSERLRVAERYVSSLLSFADHLGAEDFPRREIFELVETLRALTITGPALPRVLAEDPELSKLRAAALEARGQLNDMVSGTLGADASGPAEAERIVTAVRARDRADSLLRGGLEERGAQLPDVELSRLAEALPEGSAAVAYRCYRRVGLEPDAAGFRTRPALLAWVVRPDGSLSRIELGELEPVARAAGAWLSGLQEEGAGERAPGIGGVAPARPRPVGEEARRAGLELRRLVLDPVLAAAGEARALHVCPDGLLHLVPLDALPAEDGVVGDGTSLFVEVSLARLLGPAPSPADGTAGLLAMGGMAYDASIPAAPRTTQESVPAPPVSVRSGEGARPFAPLFATAEEAEGISALFERSFDRPATLLRGEEATRARFRTLAPGARFLHLATHGYYADERYLPAAAEARAGADPPRPGWGDEIAGLAPMTLCGLAFAGANEGMDELGRVPGILTAEELAGLDLRACELAVLSACQTGAGRLQDGQGIQSLRGALHAAGVRTALTALWKVDDAWTRKLMLAFYRHLWVDELPAHQALWRAKSELREQGAGLRHWAGWVLTGDPD